MLGRGSTPIAITPARKTWMRMGAGVTYRTMAMYGFRMSRRTGLLIATATGCMSPITAGPGLATNLGDGRLITTVAGCITTAPGPGGPVRSTAAGSTVLSGLRHMSPSGDGAADGASALATAVGVASAGCRSGRAIISILGGA